MFLSLFYVRSDEEMTKFMHLMNSIWNICGKDVVTAFDLSPFKSIYDLGGKVTQCCPCDHFVFLLTRVTGGQ